MNRAERLHISKNIGRVLESNGK